jgi:transmembrane sensor
MQVQRKIEELLAMRASEWLELLPSATEEERAAFARWLGESRLHVQEFLEVAEIEYRLHRADPQRQQDIDALLKSVTNVVRLPHRATPARVTPPVQNRRAWKVAAALAACAVLASALVFIPRGGEDEFMTSVGEQRTIELPDMSIVTLNASSDIEVRIERDVREIDLTRGEAIFTVAHDPERPFRVHTRAGIVQAVGTQFNVYDRPDGTTRVSVLEGRVRLIPNGRSGAASIEQPVSLLGAGEEADILPDGRVQKNEKAVVANTVAWRQRRLVFDSAPLEDMVAEFNRYNRAPQLQLDDIPPDSFRYYGIFDAADPESFVKLLEREPALTVERRGQQVIVRRRAAETD